MEPPALSTPLRAARCHLHLRCQIKGRERQAGSGELDRRKQQIHDHQQQQQQAATVVSCTYVGNVEMALTRAAYQVQSFRHAMGLEERLYSWNKLLLPI
jgi:hypothetical protein